jgi:hypothetical protein
MGVLAITETVAVISRGFCGLSCKSATSPTRMPLNRTAAPTSKPDTVCSKRTR